MTRRIQLGNRSIGDTDDVYIIAEIGVNHEGSLDLAKRLIELAREGGAHAAKFQSYKAETLASKHSPAYWDTTKEPTPSQYQLFKKYDAFGADEYRALAEHCGQVGIDFLSTPFDAQAVDFLASLVPCFKVASADLTNLPMLRQVAAYGKPVLLSTGASTLGEIDIAVNELRRAGCAQLALLHCILNYPTDNANAHLAMIAGLRRAYPDVVIGYSDHTLPDAGMIPLTVAYLLGARVMEKHFTHDKTLPGNDHYHAMDVHDLQRLVEQIGRVRTLLGPSDHKQPIATEEISRLNARRSIVLAMDVAAGTVLAESVLTYKRPGTGISPLHWDKVVGCRARRALEADHVLQWDDLIVNPEPGSQ
ncbi:MAG TPA: N-acetylneuraminate synthase family protein [Candidatus Acidoferrales bacterium]|nr:N-acetylneuraminate synthase family protein [Candidatus Acidoferrales bacterium]